MKEALSCRQANEDSMNHVYFSIAHLYKEERVMKMHIHDCYEIYYSISGAKQFLIDNRIYPIRPGDIFVLNQYESHYISQLDSSSHERIVIAIHPDYIRRLSSGQTDLSKCFMEHPASFRHRLSLSKSQQQKFLYYINQLLSTNSEYGQDLLERAIFTELLVFLNRCYRESANVPSAEPPKIIYSRQVDAILYYINQNIGEPLSIEELSRHFYLSESYICRIFKASTGMTINKYITARRISIAKALLSEGMNVSLVCAQCGYNDYSNFVRAFSKAVGISPKKYAMLTAELVSG